MDDDALIETIADGLRLQVGTVASDVEPSLLEDEPGAYVIGFAIGASEAMGQPVGNHTVRVIERACRQGLPREGDVGQRLADVATRLLVLNRLDAPHLAEARATGEEEGRAFVDDNAPPSALADLIGAET
jgi:hypothetical protein